MPHPMQVDRQKHLEHILLSDAQHKLVVAGPGTGKTYTFKQLLLRNPGNNLVMTFINNLVEEMAEDIGSLADVRTFHSYCRMLLHKLPVDGLDQSFVFFPKLGEVIALDAAILAPHLRETYGGREAFEEAFRALIENDGRIDFSLERASFYNAVGYDDSVYRVLSFFRHFPEAAPSHQLLILDEYQDFNALEVAFIGILEQKSPTLIVGDDDQAIYGFRQATPDHLRRKTLDRRYTRFPLPYCTRCTEIIIAGARSIISAAQNVGLLSNRLDKDLVCYLPDKAADSAAYPSIILAQCSTHTRRAPYIAKYIEHAIQAIPRAEVDLCIQKRYPLALVVGPSHYLSQVHEYLQPRLPNIRYTPRADANLTLLDAYECLLRDAFSNLGWRVILELESPDAVASTLLSALERGCRLFEVVDGGHVKSHLARLEQLSLAAKDPDALPQDQIDALETYFRSPIDDVLAFLLRSSDRERSSDQEDSVSVPPLQEGFPVIRLTTYSGCKGLSAAFTFVTGLEDGVFPRSNSHPTDTEVCQLIVAMTRTRKQCHLVTTRRFADNWCHSSAFLQWLPPESIRSLVVDKSFFAPHMTPKVLPPDAGSMAA